jgi:UDPglucose 6-dehydrogenase
MKKDKKIGFIGQGWIGKNYADDFEERGYDVVRYTRSEPYKKNKEILKECDIVFIAIPTPTTPDGFDASAVREVLKLVGKGKCAVIKSTILPGTTESIQKENPDVLVFHSPEFLREKTAKEDAKNPDRNIVGYTDVSKEKAQDVLDVLPKAPYEKIMPVKEAEMIKYAGNVFLAMKVVFANMLFDLSEKLGTDYELVKEAVVNDPRIGPSHMDIVSDSGRGAGGHCFIKDLAAFADIYEEKSEDKEGTELLKAFEKKNIKLLKDSKKNLDLLEGVYGKDV